MSIIPAIQEAEVRRFEVQVHLGQKVSETISQPVSHEWWWRAVVSAIWEVLVGGPYGKNN
jgi:hypothetical protein